MCSLDLQRHEHAGRRRDGCIQRRTFCDSDALFDALHVARPVELRSVSVAMGRGWGEHILPTGSASRSRA